MRNLWHSPPAVVLDSCMSDLYNLGHANLFPTQGPVLRKEREGWCALHIHTSYT
jgi:hypothetical protein